GEVMRMRGVMIERDCASYATPPVAVTLDIDDTLDVVHGFNAHYDERCFLPIHVYGVATSRPLAVLLRPGKTPSGQEVTGHLRRLVRRIRRHWPTTRITLRGDSHYSRPEVMDFCEQNDTSSLIYFIVSERATSTACAAFWNLNSSYRSGCAVNSSIRTKKYSPIPKRSAVAMAPPRENAVQSKAYIPSFSICSIAKRARGVATSHFVRSV